MITDFPEPDFQVLVLENPEALAREVATRFTRAAGRAIDAGTLFRVALAGGSTPLETYRMLGTDPFRHSVHWPSVQLFWGDERFVPHDHPESNYRAAREALLEHLPAPPGGVFPIPTDAGSPGAAASAYQETLMQAFEVQPPAVPAFDLVLLGLGSDGHTASLFPGALPPGGDWVAAVRGPGTVPDRITLSPRVLNAARVVLFLVAGEGKAESLERVLRSGTPDPDLPATLIRPAGGNITWLVERTAATRIVEDAAEAGGTGGEQDAPPGGAP